MPVFARRSLLWVLLLASLGASVAGDDEPKKPDPKAEKVKYLHERLKVAQFTGVTSKSPYRLEATPVFRWENPISRADGAIFAWTLEGRPMVLCKSHVNDPKQHYVASFTSLSPEAFLMKQDGQEIWPTTEPGINRKVVSKVAPPAATENARLIQMRTIARRYRLISQWGLEKSGDWELRLLGTPLMRYSSPSAGVVDGAVFGYAQGTNPEAVVIVEAVKWTQGTEWQTAPARLSGYAIRGWFDEDEVLEVPKIQSTQNSGGYRYVYEKPVPYPFPVTAE